MRDKSGWVNSVIGIAVIGSAITGVAALLVALASALSGDWMAAGTCLIAAALAFGLLAGAFLGGQPKPGM